MKRKYLLIILSFIGGLLVLSNVVFYSNTIIKYDEVNHAFNETIVTSDIVKDEHEADSVFTVEEGGKQSQDGDDNDVSSKKDHDLQTKISSASTPSFDNFCSAFRNHDGQTSSIPPSATYLWKKYSESIIAASDFRSRGINFMDFTAKMFNIITPQRLHAAMKALPRTHQQWETIGDILDVAYKRWKFVKERRERLGPRRHYGKESADMPRKVNILIMGGSVTLGVECFRNPVRKKFVMAFQVCSWTTRLNSLVHKILGQNIHDIVEVTSIAMGGTNSAIATTIWDFTLMAENTAKPDIVIHGFATNDMHVLTIDEAQERGLTLEEMIFEMNQKFVRSVLTPKVEPSSTCVQRSPLLIYYDDYIGNEQRKILDTDAFSKAANVLSSYYGFSWLSYAEAVKDIVYSDTYEEWFSPHGWPERQIHPGMGMHITSTWVFAYYFLHMSSTYCSLYPEDASVGAVDVAGVKDAPNSTSTTTNSLMGSNVIRKEKDYIPTIQNGLPQFKEPELKINKEPKIYDHPTITTEQSNIVNSSTSIIIPLPPELNDSLTLDDISAKWFNETMKLHSHKGDDQYSNNNNKPMCNIHDKALMPRQCMFSWLGNFGNILNEKDLEKKLNETLSTNHGEEEGGGGWEASFDHKKVGYVATKPNAVFEMELKNITAEVGVFTFMITKSYGEKWDKSKIHVDVYVTKTKDETNRNKSESKEEVEAAENDVIVVEKSLEMTGYHSKNTTEMYTNQLVLNEDEKASVGNDLRLKFKLVGGTTFKIRGMAFCP